MISAPTRVAVTHQTTTLADLRPLAQPRYNANELRLSGGFAKIKQSSAFMFRDADSRSEHRQSFVGLLKRAVAQELSTRPGAGVTHFPQGDADALVERHKERGDGTRYTVRGFTALLRELDQPAAVPPMPVRAWTAPASSEGGNERLVQAAPTPPSVVQEPTAADFMTPPSKPAAARNSSRLSDLHVASIAIELQAITPRLDPETTRKLASLVVERGGSDAGRTNELHQAKRAVTTWVARQIGADTAIYGFDPGTHPGRKPYWDILQQKTATPAPR